ncbi:hypothetical protein HKX48_008860 [Thoreauomyces humboldtii]|nr:hypothetical protein HKX48_008860 [Thoreauomyces humboldtii]
MTGIMGKFVENLPRTPDRSQSKPSGSPLTLLRSMTPLQGLLFVSGWLAWTCDAIDFFAVSLTISGLSVTFNEPTSSITTSITLTLLFRPLGAIIFGLLSDRYGRKWPLIVNLLCCSVLSLGTGFVTTFSQFLAVRSLFGIMMGGIWGQAASLGLENAPVDARGLLSGIMQQGYAVGYLLAAVVNLQEVIPRNDWRILFWFGASFSAFAAFVRLLLPESAYFLERRAAARADGGFVSEGEKTRIFFREMGKAIRLHWIRCIFCLVLMSAFNFYSHGSQDLYPTYIQKGKGLSAHLATVATIIGNCGAVVGGTIAGYVSQYLGRRITIIICCCFTLVFLPLWYLPTSFAGLSAGAFFVQAGVQGAWGVIPVYLSELSPVAFRSTFPGVMYQLGNMVSSASAQIETTAGDRYKTSEGLPDYGKVSLILIGVISGVIIVCALVGREEHAAQFEKGRAAFERDSGADIIEIEAKTDRDHQEAQLEKLKMDQPV